jgi:CubicO group peptidase (beta-lactamase class C family)
MAPIQRVVARSALAALVWLSLLLRPVPAVAVDSVRLQQAMARAATLPRLHALIILHGGAPVLERVFRGPSLSTPVDIKSLSKIVIDSLVGIAVDRGLLQGTDEKMLPLLRQHAPSGLDRRVGAITIGELLSMRAGLERTSGRRNYGRWVSSSNWVRFALTRPFVEQPGGAMLYSTGNTHLLSAILTDVTGESTLELARRWLGQPLDIDIPAWMRDPQGIYFGGNEMVLSPRALAKIGETYRLSGSYQGRRILSSEWVRRSWTPQATDRWGHHYGYGWFISQADGVPVYFGWGFGGQMLYVVPSLELTVVMTSDATQRSVEDDYVCALHRLLAEQVMGTYLEPAPPANGGAALCTLSKDAASQL